MADLDDFFAKKDRKKSKGKKFTTTEEIAKKLEETGKKSEKPKKDKPIIQSSINLQENDDVSVSVIFVLWVKFSLESCPNIAVGSYIFLTTIWVYVLPLQMAVFV